MNEIKPSHMFSSSQLSDAQIEQLHAWVSEGAQLAEVQKHLVEDFGFSVTYMDARFVALDLDLQFVKEEVIEEAKPEEALNTEEQAAETTESPSPSPIAPESEGGFQPVTAAVDTVARPGAMVSGTVSFSDGEKGRWMIDDMGRPSVDPDTPGYQPTESDLMDFQNRLRDLLQNH